MLVGLVASVAYCSWPLGFILNPALTRTGLASDLEVHGQPFFWLFILLDCICGIATIVVAMDAWSLRGNVHERIVFGFYALFGVATAIDALVPVNCGSKVLASCGADLTGINFDDILTGIAVLALFVAAVLAEVQFVRIYGWTRYSVSSLVVTVSWSAFGLYYFAEHFSQKPAVVLQHIMLTMTSVVAFLVVLAFHTRPRLQLPTSADGEPQSDKVVSVASSTMTSTVAES